MSAHRLATLCRQAGPQIPCSHRLHCWPTLGLKGAESYTYSMGASRIFPAQRAVCHKPAPAPVRSAPTSGQAVQVLPQFAPQALQLGTLGLRGRPRRVGISGQPCITFQLPLHLCQFRRQHRMLPPSCLQRHLAQLHIVVGGNRRRQAILAALVLFETVPAEHTWLGRVDKHVPLQALAVGNAPNPCYFSGLPPARPPHPPQHAPQE